MNNNNVIEYKEMCFDSNLNVFRNADNGDVINNPPLTVEEYQQWKNKQMMEGKNEKVFKKVQLVRLNLDEERIKDINTNNGFIISKRQNINKDVKSDEGIFSSKFGKTLSDANAYENRYKCKCGHLQGTINKGMTCEYCHTQVKFISDNFEYFGWICIKEPYAVIHPNLFKSLQAFIGGKELDRILSSNDNIDENGFIKEKDTNKNSPFIGLGMIEFREKFYEVMEFYKNKNIKKPQKLLYYQDIMENADKVFTHSIPVYTTQLRPFNIDGTKFNFEGNNEIYNNLAAQAAKVNKDILYIRTRTGAKKSSKAEKQLLYAMQKNINDIYSDLEKQLSGKKGYVRSLIGGRFNFCSKVIIVPNPELEIDEIKLPYAAMLEIFQQRIVNILSKTYIPSEAYKMWDSARNCFDRNIANLIESIIESEYVGVFFGRNPSLHSESIRQMRVVGLNYDYSCGVPLQILTGFGADFDGDTMYAMWINNKETLEVAMRIFNPRYAGQISRNDGLFNNNVALQSDTMIGLNSFAFLGRDYYSNEALDKIRLAKMSRKLK